MGVSGAGKTTIGQLLARELGWQFRDADDFHSQVNKDKMHQGIALTDQDRLPWLASMADNIAAWVAASEKSVLACSALKQSYRAQLAQGREEVAVVYLKASFESIAQRLAARTDHFMNKDLLQSQFATLEEPGANLDSSGSGGQDQGQAADGLHKGANDKAEIIEALVVDATKTPQQIVSTIRQSFAL